MIYCRCYWVGHLWLFLQVYAAVLELCLRTVRTSLTAGRNKEDLLTQWYTALPPQAIVGPGSRKLHLGALKYLVQVRVVRYVCWYSRYACFDAAPIEPGMTDAHSVLRVLVLPPPPLPSPQCRP